MVVPHHLREVPIFTKERLSKWLINLKLKQTVKASVVTSSSRHPPLQPLPPSPQQQTLNVLVDDEQHNKPPPDSDSDWVVFISDKLDQACQDDVATSTCAKQCINKVPHHLREGNDRSYVPQIVSIGPYHHGKERLRSMDQKKWRSLQQILKRTKHDVKIYLNGLKEIEDRIRACYEEPISFESDEFVLMILLDGCFILELFQGAADGFEKLGYARNDPIFSTRGSMMHRIQRDLIMLENQLPLFVLDLLLGIQLGQPEQKRLVSKLALMFFEPLAPAGESYVILESYGTTLDPLLDQDSLHCLELFYRLILWQYYWRGLPEPIERVWMKKRWSRWSSYYHAAVIRGQKQWIPCVTALRDAGFKFKRRRTDRFWDVKYKNRILKIPTLLIHDGTKSLFLNLIAFEQCHLDCDSGFTSYVIFMDNLINSPEDVGYLHYCGIIKHSLGSDAVVADLFNHLGQQVVFHSRSISYLSLLADIVLDDFFHGFRWHTWRESLKRNYFSNPWTIISLFAAVILLLLTLAQTFYTVYGYYRPSGN
ncbi:hypothetical protein QQ045_020283 [Rhodiola kirilowii]